MPTFINQSERINENVTPTVINQSERISENVTFTLFIRVKE